MHCTSSGGGSTGGDGGGGSRDGGGGLRELGVCVSLCRSVSLPC